MNTPVVQQLPAGMMDKGAEIFAYGKKQYCFTSGRRLELSRAPEEIKQAIREHMESRPLAIQALKSKGITDPDQQILQYARCVCGGYQGKADIVDGKLIATEYWDCGVRGNCDIEGVLCCSKVINGNIVTAREIELCRWIASGLPDKLIADKMGISTNTINPMKRNISQKIGSITKVDITRFFITKNFQIYDFG